jgi:hypothetical protein
MNMTYSTTGNFSRTEEDGAVIAAGGNYRYERTAAAAGRRDIEALAKSDATSSSTG